MSEVTVPALSSTHLLELCAAHGLDAAAVVDLLREAAGHGEREALEYAAAAIKARLRCNCAECMDRLRQAPRVIAAALNRQQSCLAALLADPGTTEEGLRRWLPEAIAKARG